MSGHYLPPQTATELAARTRAILAGVATITVDPEALAPATGPVNVAPTPTSGTQPLVPAPSAGTDGPLPPLPAISGPTPSSPDDGSAIYGTLTSAQGRSGGFLLNVYATTPPLQAGCSGDVSACKITHRDDGTSVSVGHWSDSSVPGGITYEVTAVRPDGANISILLSTESDPKGQNKVTSPTVPLTVDQLIAFVTSDQW